MLTPGANGQANLPAVATTLLFEHCPVAVVVCDGALRVIAFNEPITGRGTMSDT